MLNMKKSCSDFGRDSGRVPSSLVKYFCNIGRRNSFDKFMSFQRCEINRRCDSMALWHSVIDTNNLNYLLNPTPISVLNLKFMKRTTSKLYVLTCKQMFFCCIFWCEILFYGENCFARSKFYVIQRKMFQCLWCCMTLRMIINPAG